MLVRRFFVNAIHYLGGSVSLSRSGKESKTAAILSPLSAMTGYGRASELCQGHCAQTGAANGEGGDGPHPAT
jgi:hypothetical protein